MNRITDAHKSKLACVYARHNSLSRIRNSNNCESTERQRNLVTHVEPLEWEESHVVLIDEDLGCNGTNMIDLFTPISFHKLYQNEHEVISELLA